MSRSVIFLILLWLSGCATTVEQVTPAVQNYETVWMGTTSPEDSKGYTINGLHPGNTLKTLRSSFKLEAGPIDSIVQLTDSKTGIDTTLTVDEKEQVLVVHIDDRGSLERDGKLLLRVGDPSEKARIALGAGPKVNTIKLEGENSVLVVNLNHQGVYSLELFDTKYFLDLKR